MWLGAPAPRGLPPPFSDERAPVYDGPGDRLDAVADGAPERREMFGAFHCFWCRCGRPRRPSRAERALTCETVVGTIGLTSPESRERRANDDADRCERR